MEISVLCVRMHTQNNGAGLFAEGIKLKPSLVLNHGEDSPEARCEPHMGLGGHSGQRRLQQEEVELEAAPRKWLDPGSVPEHEAMLTLQNSGETWSFSQLSSTVPPGDGIASLAVVHPFRVLRVVHFLSPV